MKNSKAATLHGVKITQRNAESLVKRSHPRASVSGSTGFDGERDYFVYPGGPTAGAMYIAYGKTKLAAWKAAAVTLAERQARPEGVQP